MTAVKRLIVVDDNWRFVVHVWRHLTGVMEFGLSDPRADRTSDGNAPPFEIKDFERTSPDGSLQVVWHRPAPKLEDSLTRFVEDCKHPEDCKHHAPEVWCIIDVRGVQDSEKYRKTFESLHPAERAWVMSSYGQHNWGAGPVVRPKTFESLQELARTMGVEAQPRPTRTSRSRHMNVLVTGAGFELKEDVQVGTSIGCPWTSTLLDTMRTPDYPTQRSDSNRALIFPNFYKSDAIEAAAVSGDLDAWWDAVLAYFQTNMKSRDAAKTEVEWREAFRRSLLEHDYGQQLQSIAAAELDWDYWLTTNYTRFADRAIDRTLQHSRGGKKKRGIMPWRAMTTPIEADTVAPLMGSTDLAATERVMIKLHGDIGHVWTMAIAGADKLPESRFTVRPQLHRMYSVAESILLGTLWRRVVDSCTWHVVGHGLQDESLVRLIAAVVQRSAHVPHRMVYVGPPRKDRKRPLDVLRQRFADAEESSFAKKIVPENGESGPLTVRFDERTAVQYMSLLRARGLEAVNADPPSDRAARVSDVVLTGNLDPEAVPHPSSIATDSQD